MLFRCFLYLEWSANQPIGIAVVEPSYYFKLGFLTYVATFVWIVLGIQPRLHRARPNPRPDCDACPRGIPLAIPLARGIPPPLDDAPPRPLVVLLGAGVENLEDTFDEAGGWSTKDVSVVKNVAS